jgi:hypothetical protein
LISKPPSQLPETIFSPPEPTYASDKSVLRLLVGKQPLDTPGAVAIDRERQVVWKNLCMIGPHHIECVVEFSITKTKFFILVIDLFSGQYHALDLWGHQA